VNRCARAGELLKRHAGEFPMKYIDDFHKSFPRLGAPSRFRNFRSSVPAAGRWRKIVVKPGKMNAFVDTSEQGHPGSELINWRPGTRKPWGVAEFRAFLALPRCRSLTPWLNVPLGTLTPLVVDMNADRCPGRPLSYSSIETMTLLRFDPQSPASINHGPSFQLSDTNSASLRPVQFLVQREKGGAEQGRPDWSRSRPLFKVEG